MYPQAISHPSCEIYSSVRDVICLEVATPLVLLVVGGDRFTLDKLAEATFAGGDIPVVIVNGSGEIASMIAETYKALRLQRQVKHTDMRAFIAFKVLRINTS